MNDEEIEQKYSKLIKVKQHIDAIKEDWDDETLEELKEFLYEKYSIDTDEISKTQLLAENAAEQKSGDGFLTRIKDAFEKNVGIDPGRLLSLTDGIFGMVMTLLIFGITIPEVFISSYSNYINFFSSLLPTIGVTIVSFVIISSFWIYHHEYMKVNNLNIPYLWLNILFLICISFIPFTTSLIGNYSEFFLSEVIFGINILLTIISFLLMYIYAYKRDFLEYNPSKQENNQVLVTLGSIMALVIVVNLLDFNVSSKCIYLLLLIPVLSTTLDIYFQYRKV